MLLLTRATPTILRVYSKRGGAIFSGTGGSLASGLGPRLPGLAVEERVLIAAPGFLDALRAAESAEQALSAVRKFELADADEA